MPRASIGDEFYDHPKVRDLPREIRNEGVGVWTRAISYCNRHLTDGRIKTAVLIEAIDARPEVIEALIKVHLFDRSGPAAVRVHEFHQGSLSREEVLTLRAKRAEAGRKGGQRSGEARRAKQTPKPKQSASSKTNPSSIGMSPSSPSLRSDDEGTPRAPDLPADPGGPDGGPIFVPPPEGLVDLQKLAEVLTGRANVMSNTFGGLGLRARELGERRGWDRAAAAFRAVADQVNAEGSGPPDLRQLVFGAEGILSPVPRITNGGTSPADQAERDAEELRRRATGRRLAPSGGIAP